MGMSVEDHIDIFFRDCLGWHVDEPKPNPIAF